MNSRPYSPRPKDSSDDPRFMFLMIGGGNRFRRIEAASSKIARLGPRYSASCRIRSGAMLRYSLGVPDAHWLSLNPKLEG